MSTNLRQYGSDVYVSPAGYVCISQPTLDGPDEAVILFAPEEIPNLLERLEATYQEALDHVPPPDESA